MTLQRRTAMRRDGPGARAFTAQRSQLTRDTPAARRFADQRSQLPAKSERRKAEDPERARLRRLVRERDGNVCQGRLAVPLVQCWGDLDVDAICPEGVRPGAHLVLENLHLLCRGHHDWKHANARLAVAAGLRRWSWQT